MRLAPRARSPTTTGSGDAGVARIATRHRSAVTNLFIALRAASLTSQRARTLLQAGLIEAGSSALCDRSALLSQDSALDTQLHALAGHDA
jgi:hypothetical protein